MSFDFVYAEFEQWASNYDADASTRMHYEGHSMVMEKVGAFARTARTIVDLGTGTGLVIKGLRDQFPAATINGYDLSPSMLARCAEKGIADTLVECDLREAVWPIEEEAADIVTAAGLLDFIKDPEKFLINTNMIMKPGAVAALTYEVKNLGGKKGPFGASPSYSYLQREMQQYASNAGLKVLDDEAFKGYAHMGSAITYSVIVLEKPAP